MRRLALAIVLAVGVAGCYSPSYTDGQLPCSGQGACPSGLYCATDNFCWHVGSGPGGDGGPTVDASPTVDAGPDSAPAVPAAVWMSSGGGSVMAPSGRRLQLTVGGVDSFGVPTATSGAKLTFGFFPTVSE